MKTEQEQIEEMAKIACATCAAGACCEPVDARPCDAALEYAEALYDAGYRKAYKVRNETAKEFAEKVKMAFYYEFDEIIPSIMADKIDELLKEYGVEK